MYLEKVREKKALIHHITNYVVANETANMTLALGAIPVMSSSIDEVEEMVKNSSALLLNIGTLDEEQVEAMVLAGKKANQHKIPVVLDPVGAGATSFRTETVRRLIRNIKFAAIRGNSAEVSIIAGYQARIAGVESLEASDDISTAVKELAYKCDCVVCASGKEDILSDGKKIVKIKNGHPLLGAVTGTGCMATTALSVFLGACKEANNYYDAAIEAISAFGIVGELAASKAKDKPGSFHQELYNAAYNLDDKTVNSRKKVEKIE